MEMSSATSCRISVRSTFCCTRRLVEGVRCRCESTRRGKHSAPHCCASKSRSENKSFERYAQWCSRRYARRPRLAAGAKSTRQKECAERRVVHGHSRSGGGGRKQPGCPGHF